MTENTTPQPVEPTEPLDVDEVQVEDAQAADNLGDDAGVDEDGN